MAAVGASSEFDGEPRRNATCGVVDVVKDAETRGVVDVVEDAETRGVVDVVEDAETRGVVGELNSHVDDARSTGQKLTARPRLHRRRCCTVHSARDIDIVFYSH